MSEWRFIGGENVRHFRLFFALPIVFCTISANAAVVIESFESFTPGTIITDQIAGLAVSAAMGGNAVISLASDPVLPFEPHGLYNDAPGQFDRGFEFALIFDFVTSGFTIGAIVDFGEIGTGLQVVAYDGPNGTGNVLGIASTTTETFIGVTAPGIKSAVFSQAGDTPATWLIDNLTYETIVPAPPALLLFATALAAAGFVRRPSKRASPVAPPGIVRPA